MVSILCLTLTTVVSLILAGWSTFMALYQTKLNRHHCLTMNQLSQLSDWFYCSELDPRWPCTRLNTILLSCMVYVYHFECFSCIIITRQDMWFINNPIDHLCGKSFFVVQYVCLFRNYFVSSSDLCSDKEKKNM